MKAITDDQRLHRVSVYLDDLYVALPK